MLGKGFLFGLLFCLISAAFDVYVAFVTQAVSTILVVFYCFIVSTAFFVVCALWSNSRSFFTKVREQWGMVVVINLAVLFNWGGLFYALRYLEPAVVGVAAVACGPALTLLISFFDRRSARVAFADALVSCLVLISVGIMLFNSFSGNSGIATTTSAQRLLGIASVVLCALGTVIYTVFSKQMFARHWSIFEILAVRNIAMVGFCVLVVSIIGGSITLDRELLIPMIILVGVGHLLPIYLIQKTIYYLTPIHVSLVLLTLPVFVLLLQYFDARIEFSVASVLAVSIIVFLLLGRTLYELRRERL
ncbi:MULTISPECIES: DMT family transporter [Pseudomonas]|jgi:drug/metabolite transporter (DMT)-like permease|uniref:DMT family transporter n=1 Tax=Pseudomonas rhodesiae TaxID=76760 RepID=A0A8I1JH95_9PSED|nr:MULTISPECIES: DMT family transporter [Pseudomonas]MBB4815173.1 drug/metabolite transporter (DMT)-like permease [Pseudomonas rhodesiae]MBI6604577.1 DMT family transporter [Pseudomonas sp. S4_EA_1b]MBI6627185.1 DMT family transporter [Pseudomonas rhodesiae]MBX4135685.1 DMT family transporter [Pseudomonas sp. S5F11]MDN6864646.1 DMT family transporter [Pseudomonas rhodesiae]